MESSSLVSSQPAEDDFFTKYSGSSLSNIAKPNSSPVLSGLKTVSSSPAIMSLKHDNSEFEMF